MVGELQNVVQAKLELVHENVSELCTNTTKVHDHISVRFNGVENIMPSAVIFDKLAQLQIVESFIMELRSHLPNDRDLWFTRDAEWLAIVKQNHVPALYQYL